MKVGHPVPCWVELCLSSCCCCRADCLCRCCCLGCLGCRRRSRSRRRSCSSCLCLRPAPPCALRRSNSVSCTANVVHKDQERCHRSPHLRRQPRCFGLMQPERRVRLKVGLVLLAVPHDIARPLGAGNTGVEAHPEASPLPVPERRRGEDLGLRRKPPCIATSRRRGDGSAELAQRLPPLLRPHVGVPLGLDIHAYLPL